MKVTRDRFVLSVHFKRDCLFVLAHFAVPSAAEARKMLDSGMSLRPEAATLWLWIDNEKCRELCLDDGYTGDDQCGRWTEHADRGSQECYVDALLPYDKFLALCCPGLSFTPSWFAIVRYEYDSRGKLKGLYPLESGDICTPAMHQRYSEKCQRTG